MRAQCVYHWRRYASLIVIVFVFLLLSPISIYERGSRFNLMEASFTLPNPISDTRVGNSYLGRHRPRTWNISLDPVSITIENSAHYGLSTDMSELEWASLLPPGNGTIYLGPVNGPKRAFTISLFHQLGCLSIIRDGLVLFRRTTPGGGSEGEAKPDRLVVHCMNYLRQMVLCRSNTRLQSVRNHTGYRVTVNDVTETCKDWTQVFEEAESNYRNYDSGS